jgi:hypothetical protein
VVFVATVIATSVASTASSAPRPSECTDPC